MLSDTEKKGCIDILKRLTYDDLESLKDTVTNKLIAVEGKQEAIKVILAYTETAEQLLKRKKVKRDLLFQYLHDNNFPVPPTAEKSSLIRKTMQLWGSQPANVLSENHSNESITTDVQTSDERKNTKKEQELAKQFVPWFYNMLNSHNPTFPSKTEDQFSPVHFFDDCRLNLICNAADSRLDEFSGSQLVCQRFLAFVQEELLTFNPNTSPDGLRALSEPHGLVVVMVCGTVHRQNTCLGIFEQSFGLVKDPLSDSNWKIKCTTLKMLSTPVTQVPKLGPGSNAHLPAIEGP